MNEKGTEDLGNGKKSVLLSNALEVWEIIFLEHSKTFLMIFHDDNYTFLVVSCFDFDEKKRFLEFF